MSRITVIIFSALLLSGCHDSAEDECKASAKTRQQWLVTEVTTPQQLHNEIDAVMVDRPCATNAAILRKILLDMENVR